MNGSASAMLLEAGSGYLGGVIEPRHVQTMAMSFAGFTGLQSMFQVALRRVLPAERWAKLDDTEKFKISGWAVSILHAVVVVAWSIAILARQEGTLFEDTIYGSSESGGQLFAFMCAYFAWDLSMVFKSPSVDVTFLLHHIMAIFTVMTFMHPFAQVYGLAHVIYEASTPFLSARSIFLTLGWKGHSAVAMAEKLFGLSFLVARLVFGIPMSLYGIYDATDALLAGRIVYLSHYALLLFTNLTLNTLNVVWFAKILAMGSSKAKEKAA